MGKNKVFDLKKKKKKMMNGIKLFLCIGSHDKIFRSLIMIKVCTLFSVQSVRNIKKYDFLKEC